MNRPPTDLELLEEIYRRYYASFVDPRRVEKDKYSKNHVPIDIKALGAHFGVDQEIVFGRLYYHLNSKYGYEATVDRGPDKNPGIDRTDLFLIRAGGDYHVVHFPMLASIAADLRDQRNQFMWTLWLSIIATVLSVLALGVSILDLRQP